jgi:hypothetical protein
MFALLLEVYEFNEPVVDSIIPNLVLLLEVYEFKLPVVTSITPNLVLLLLVYVFKLPVDVSSDVNLPFCVTSTALLDDVKLLKSLLILPLADSNEFNLDVADDVKVFKLPVVVSITPNLVLVLLVYEFNDPVVVSITPNLALLLLVYVFNELVVDSIEFNLLFCASFTVLIEHLQQLKSLLILPLADSNEFNLPLALDVNVFKLLVVVCNVPITVLLLPVYVFNSAIEPVIPSIEFNLLFCVDSMVLFELVKLLKSVLILPLADSKELNLFVALDVNVFKEDVDTSKASNLPFCKLFVVLLDELYALKTTSSNLPVPTGTPFNVIEPEMVKAPVISVFVLTLKPSTLEIEAVTLPSAIRVKLSPVTPLAGILVRLLPSPPNDPVKDPVV